MSEPRPIVIGLTGGIGAGKSAVAAILRELGCVVADSDVLGREALGDPDIRRTLIAWWGEGILTKARAGGGRAIDRSAVARVVFADPVQRRRLEALVHPWIRARRTALFAAAPPGTPALVIDAPLLLEAGLDRECDAVIFVDAPRSVRLERLRRVRAWSESDLNRREASQLPLDVKRLRADDVVQNDAGLSDLRVRVARVFTSITNAARAPRLKANPDQSVP